VSDELVDEWTASVTDPTPRARKIADLVRSGRTAQATRLLPPERRYPLEPSPARKLGMA
jgi:hypothetical protein